MADETLQQDEPEVIETQDDGTETPEGESPQEEVENLVVEIDGDVEDEPKHFREVRRKYREAQKRIKELEAALWTQMEWSARYADVFLVQAGKRDSREYKKWAKDTNRARTALSDE